MQDSADFLNSGSRGNDVIQNKYLSVFKSSGLLEPKGAFDIATPFSQRQSELRLCVSDSRQPIEDRNSGITGQCFCQHADLIESPGFYTSPVRGYRDDVLERVFEALEGFSE